MNMELVVHCLSDGSRDVRLPPSIPEPVIVRPDLWVGQGSSHIDRFIKLSIGGPSGDEAIMFTARGYNPFWQYVFPEKGQAILKIYPPSAEADWTFVMDFAQFWLSRVFGKSVTFDIQNAPSHAATV